VDIGSLSSAPIAANLVPNILGQLVMSAVCAASAVMVTRAVAAKTTKSVSLSKASPTRARGRASVATRAVELATGETLEVKPVPMRVGHGFDLHRMETLAEMPDLELWLGGIKLEHDRGCVAHSDGDVLLHCVFDAITGALGLPDIGQCFPDNDPKWKGCTSDVFIKEAVRLMRDSGYEMGNIDCTIIAQKPKISPHKKAIKDEPREAFRVRRRRGERQGEDAREGGLARREQEHRVPHRVHARQGVSFVGVCYDI
jgi:2-C-methyl-D-erythritol 2,4-cyclodiphosphate synthase